MELKELKEKLDKINKVLLIPTVICFVLTVVVSYLMKLERQTNKEIFLFSLGISSGVLISTSVFRFFLDKYFPKKKD